MCLEEIVFQWPVHSKLDQVVPYMCSPCMEKKGCAMCFHLQSLLQTFFHTLKNFCSLLCLKEQKVQYFRALGLEGLFENSAFMTFISLGCMGRSFCKGNWGGGVTAVSTPDSELRRVCTHKGRRIFSLF